jgi:hypothetical protein
MFRGDRDRAKALEEALERLRADPESTALGDEELQRLASMAMEVRRELDVPGPSAAFRRASRARVVRAMRARQSQREGPSAPAWRRTRFPRLSYVLASLALAVALVTSGVGVAQAAGSALPGDALYGVKQGLEKGRLLFTFSAQGDFELLSEFAAERLSEVERLIALGRTDQVGGTVLEYERLLDDITALAPQVDTESGSGPLIQVESRLQNHIQVLEQVKSHVPENAQEALGNALDNALERSSHSQEVLEKIQEGESPSEIAPGQLKKTQEALDAEETLEAGPEEPPQGPQTTPGPPESPPGRSKDKQKDKDKDKGSHPSNPGLGREGAPGQQD